MRCLEVIRLRGSTRQAADARAAAQALLRQVRGRPGLVDAALYVHARLDGDLAVHLLWERETPRAETETGHLVAEHLRAFGLVDRSAWKEQSK